MDLLRKYNYLIILMVFGVMLYMSYGSYERTKGIIRSKYEAQARLVEHSVTDALNSANQAYSISEKILNREMEYYSGILLSEYEENPKMETWDLDELKKKMADYHIYVIDSNLRIIKTTFEIDLGMDFSKYPSFAELLRSRLRGNGFTADKMDISTNTGEMRKYSYMPTSDHRYLIELSIDVDDRFSVLKDLNVFSLARDLTKEYQSVEDISFYKFNHQARNVGMIKDKQDPIDIDIPEHSKALVREAVLSNATSSKEVREGSFTRTYKYLPVLVENKEGENDWWNSFVIGVTYNNKEMMNDINKETRSFVISTSIIALVFASFIAAMVYLLKKTEHLAYHDHLTGLPNRKAFERYFNETVSKINSRVALLYLDLDDFKQVNDSHGHGLGDKLLTEVGTRLCSIVRTKDKVSRVGGDEFIILLTDISSESDVSRVMEKLKEHLAKPFNIDGEVIEIRCSVGASIASDEDVPLEWLINKADLSMYTMKSEKSVKE